MISVAVALEKALVELRAICPPEHYEAACLAARDRGQERGLGPVDAVNSVYEDIARGKWPAKTTCDGYEWRGDVPWKCRLPPGHKAPDGTFLGRSCKGTQTVIIDASPDDATTCPGCRVAVKLGEFCKCPMRWKG